MNELIMTGAVLGENDFVLFDMAGVAMHFFVCALDYVRACVWVVVCVCVYENDFNFRPNGHVSHILPPKNTLYLKCLNDSRIIIYRPFIHTSCH